MNKNWVVYELVDPLTKRVLHRDFDSIEYVRMLAPCPVVEGPGPVADCLAAGRIPELRIVDQGLGRERARELVESWDKGALALASAFQQLGLSVYR